jgi:hypothetical protein
MDGFRMSNAQPGIRCLGIVTLALALGACGGEDDSSGAANTAPTITGTPPTAVAPGTAYAFAPTVVDADGDAVVFAISAKPAWAAFDTATGRLSGTPTTAHVGVHRGIVISVSDGESETTLPAFDLTVDSAPAGANNAPTISGTPATGAVVGSSYAFTPVAADADGHPLTFSIRNRPAWATFDTATGRLQGTPASAGTFADIEISVSDGQITTALESFAIVVTLPAANRAPAISGTPMTSVEAGGAYAFVPTASDPDGNTLTFSISNRPAWATFDSRTGRLAGIAPAGSTGTFSNIVIAVSDGTASATLPAFAIAVRPASGNRAPLISGTPGTSARQGTPYAFQPTASDPDGNALTFSIANRPVWATFNSNTGALQGTPGAEHVRTYGNIVISVSDGIASTPLPAFSIAVSSSNAAPTITGAPPTTATAGTAYSFTPTASDPDGNTLTFSITNRPSWATFSTSTGRLQGTPTAANVGIYGNIVIRVSDGQDSAALATFSITVSDATNRAPTIGGAPGTAVMQGTSYTFTPTASDPDGDVLTYSIANRPAWATFDTATGRLQGTPSEAHVGTTGGIVISVTDGEATASLPAFAVTVQAVALGSATLSWTPPTANTDGSPLTNLAGYRIYWGTAPGSYPNSVTVNNAGLTSYVVESLVPGTYYFAATALNSSGVESAFSGTASKTIR